MTHIAKLKEIVSWFSKISGEETRKLTIQNNIEKIEEIKELIGEPLPEVIYSLYEKFNGDQGNGIGAFLGHSIIDLDEMKESLLFSKTLIKPDNPRVPNQERSDSIIELIVKQVVNELPLKKKFGFMKPKWFKVKFETGPDSIEGPYLYLTDKTSDKERIIIDLSAKAREEISILTDQLHDIELADYNWDNLEITAFKEGDIEVNRTFYNFNDELPLTSTPEGAIKKKYYHIKWIPLISDFGGNYIGLDLDPDINGKKGQVIIFGRDEENMYVIAESWEKFLDYTLQLINKGGEEFKAQDHLHDIYKKLKDV